MEQFTLEKYLADPTRKVVTRDGKNVRIICTDKKDRLGFCIIALVEDEEGTEMNQSYTTRGEYSTYDCSPSDYDLFFAPRKQSRWVFLYKTSKNGVVISSGVYEDKIQAEENCKSLNGFALTEITWEE